MVKHFLFVFCFVLFATACAHTGSEASIWTPEVYNSKLGPVQAKAFRPNEGVIEAHFYDNQGTLIGKQKFDDRNFLANGQVWYSYPLVENIEYLTFHDTRVFVVKDGGVVTSDLCSLNSVPDDKFSGRVPSPDGNGHICPPYASENERIQQEADEKYSDPIFTKFAIE